MSPLVRSLLALAALLASVNADCVVIEIGQETNNPVSLPEIHIDPPGDIKYLENKCAPGQVIGEKAVVCSQIDGDKCRPIAHLDQYSPLYVDQCLCEGGCKAFVTQFC